MDKDADSFAQTVYRWCGSRVLTVIAFGLVAYLGFFAFMVVVFNLGAVFALGTGGYVLAYAICALVLGLLAITIGVVLGRLLRRLDQRHGARNPRH